ncbi:MAG: PEP-CTERM sorting domain-containing protein [Kiritimatiellae bacterium]|nr:PEP-CTERM sorting domain-containing protein [Kiritimatiellia bacterium]
MKRTWYILAAAFLLGGFVPSAEALLLAIEAVWTSKPTNNFQPGSIVQVVVVESGQNAPTSTTDAGEHFQPYGDSFIPDTVVASGNKLIYTGTVVQRGNGFYFSAFVEVPSIYDKVYLRVFDSTGWQQGQDIPSAWGISEVHPIPDDGAGYAYTLWNDIVLPNTAKFEVIPEPGTMALLGVGSVGLAGWLRRRKREKRDQTGETGAEKP